MHSKHNDCCIPFKSYLSVRISTPFFLLQILILSLFVHFFHLLPGFPLSTLSVLLVTYCGVQLVKERERKQALLEEPEPAKLKAE